ncbi:hypothetical protein [Nonomuraea sp. SYSU D8015]|uniref:hypothetical protein n=1 Tax=Nonomuraea sp. SYSU D8015 TaxID=2593644 RepID=UPI0016607A65|nr:hypothetical protein [Nonomuraea sp. SYSU D8015]
MTEMLGAVFPLGVAIVLYLLTPLSTAKIQKVLAGQIAEDAARYGVTTQTAIPPHLSPQMIKDYVEYAADTVQIIPASLLPVIGAVFAVTTRVAEEVALIILVSTVVLAVALDSWMLTRSAPDYASRKRWGYSLVNLIGIIANIVGIVLIFWYG